MHIVRLFRTSLVHTCVHRYLVQVYFEERVLYAGAVQANGGAFPLLLDVALEGCSFHTPGVRLNDSEIMGRD